MWLVGLACWLNVVGCAGVSGEPKDEHGDAAMPNRDASTSDTQTDDASAIDGKVTAPWDATVSNQDSAAHDAPWGLEKTCGVAGGTLRIPDDLTLLADCTELLGSLTISGTNIGSLSGPDQLRSIAGSLVIASNPDLMEVRGFVRLHSIGGDLEVRANAKLTTVNAFEGLDMVGGTVTLAENAVLDAPALHASAAKLRIQANPLLSTLHDLRVNAQEATVIVGNPTLSEADAHLYANDRFTASVTISDNRPPRETARRECGAPDEHTRAGYQTLAGCTHLLGSLALQDTFMGNLKGLGNLRAIGKDVIMFRPHRIVDLSGLDNLESIGGELSITHGELLESLRGADRLRSVGGLRIESNFSLRSVAGLSALQTVTGSVSIANNDMLPQAEAQSFADGLAVGGQKLVSANGL
jgi:hypothetical protein